MRIDGMFYPEVKAEIAHVPESGQEIKLENGVIYVRVIQGKRSFLAPAGGLKSESAAWDYVVQKLIDELRWAQIKREISKAEMKRRLTAAGVIAK